MDNAFKYVEKNGLESESSYPYTGVGGTCNYSAAKVVANISNYKDVTTKSPSAL